MPTRSPLSVAINHADAFRAALNAITRVVVGLRNVAASDFYYTDLVYDAAAAADLAVGESLLIEVRDVGTWVGTPSDAGAFQSSLARRWAEVWHGGSLSSVLRVTRQPWDTFKVEVLSDAETRDLMRQAHIAIIAARIAARADKDAAAAAAS